MFEKSGMLNLRLQNHTVIKMKRAEEARRFLILSCKFDFLTAIAKEWSQDFKASGRPENQWLNYSLTDEHE